MSTHIICTKEGKKTGAFDTSSETYTARGKQVSILKMVRTKDDSGSIKVSFMPSIARDATIINTLRDSGCQFMEFYSEDTMYSCSFKTFIDPPIIHYPTDGSEEQYACPITRMNKHLYATLHPC